MGTRGYYCINHRGLYYVFYNHFDSHNLAEKIVQEVKTFTDDEFETVRCALNRVRTSEDYDTLWEAAGFPFHSPGFDGILNAACHPEDYALVGLWKDVPCIDGVIEVVVVVDLEKKVVVENGETVYSWSLDELTLQYYELWVTEGIEAAIRGVFQKITEIYVPELKMSINQGTSPVHVFISDYNKRYDSKMENMAGKPPTLVKTVALPKNSEEAQNLLWLKEVLTKKKKKEETLVKLFENL